MTAPTARPLPQRLRIVAAGMHLVATGAPGTNDRDISVRAAREGLWAMPLSSCYFGKASRPGFVLGFGGTDVPEIVDGVRRIRGILGL